MKKFILKRRYFDFGTFGTLHRDDGSQVCVVAECPNKNNKVNESCVVEGEYTMRPHHSPRFGDVYALESESLGVGIQSGLRTHILIHIANRPAELTGCLALGERFGALGDQWAVLNSTSAFKSLLKELDGKPALLTITSH